MDEKYSQEQEIFLAKWLYEHFSLLKDQSLGPAFRLQSHSYAVYDLIENGLKKILDKVPQNESGNIIKVPSPWHAVLILESLQYQLQQDKQRIIFRGQFDSTWEIEPTINRKKLTIEEKETEKFKAQLFCDIFSAISFNTGTFFSPKGNVSHFKIPANSYLAAAQHYGIATELIDFTPDPSVAIFFAANDKISRKDRTASVFGILLEEAFENGCEIIIPPPFIERLHTQRGFFIKQNLGKSKVDLKEIALLEIQFPCDYDFQPFEVIRTNIGKVNLLPESESINSILNIVSTVANENKAKKFKKSSYKKLVKDSAYQLKKDFMYILKDPMQMWAEYVDAFEDMLYWTCYFIENNELYIDDQLLMKIIDSNKELVLSISQFYRYLVNELQPDWTEKKKNFILGLAAMLEQPFYNRGELKYE